MNDRKHSRTDLHRHGFNLIEVVISTALVGLILVGAMQVLAASIRANDDAAQEGQAVLLADGLMAEILQQDYIDPDLTPSPVFGIESDEGTSSRTDFDDVDDYDDWSASPPESRTGSALPDLTGWRRIVHVHHADPDDLTADLNDANDQGVKRIVVTVERNGVVITTLTAIHTTAWINMIPDPQNNTTTGSLPSGS